MKRRYPIDTIGGEGLRLKLRYEILIEMIFELMSEIKNGIVEDINILELQLKIAQKQAREGSIAIACHDLGFDLTGFEIDKDYYEAAIKRLKNHQAQMSIPFANKRIERFLTQQQIQFKK